MDKGGAENRLNMRDKLALKRTYLASERTVLAYIRTGLALLGLGAFAYRFIEVSPLTKAFVVAATVVPGAYVTAYGVYKIALRRSERKKFEGEFKIK